MALALAHDARLNRPLKDGQGTVRDLLQRSLRSRTAWARQRAARLLTPPEYPEALEYLVEDVKALHGRSGLSPIGYAPLTYTTIADWARLTGCAPRPHEVAAYLGLDMVMLHPPEPEADDA